MRATVIAVCVVAAALSATLPATAAFDFSPKEQAWIRAHVGMYLWQEHREGPKHPDYQADELATLARRLGTNIGRTTIGGYGNAAPADQTFLQTLRLPRFQTFIRSFDVVILTIGIPEQIWQPEWTRARYQEITEYLLRTYPRKTFILGNWEGDWWCPGKHTWEEAIALFQARHDGIIAGRAAVPDATSKVLEMIEMVQLDYSGEKFMINNLVPKMKADLYSLSSWGYNNELPKAIAYMKTKCPDSPEFGDDNVMIGEFGTTNNLSPERRIEFFRKRIPELMTAKVPYVAIWELADTDCGLMDAKYNQGRKLAPYWLFWRAYHAQDQRLVIDDFEVDPLGFPLGEVNEDGQPANCLGGRQVAVGPAPVGVVGISDGPSGRSSRVLRLTALVRRSTTSFQAEVTAVGHWREELRGELDASRFQAIGFWARGDTGSLSVGVEDATGKRAGVAVTAEPSDEWCYLIISRGSLGGVDWSRLASLWFEMKDAGPVEVDDIALSAVMTPPNPASGVLPVVKPGRTTHLRSSSVSAVAEGLPETGRVKRIALSTGLLPAPLSRPRVADGSREFTLADQLGGLHTASFHGAGSAEVRLDPLHAQFRPARFPGIGLTMDGLVWDEEFRVFHAKEADRQGYIQWSFSSPHQIADFRFVLYGSDRPRLGAISGISYSTDGTNWQECAITRGDAVYPHTVDGIVGTPPADYAPSRRIWVRYWLKCASSDKDWYWHANISDIKAQLTLRTTGLAFSSAGGLRYEDGGPATWSGPGDPVRGLLSIEW